MKSIFLAAFCFLSVAAQAVSTNHEVVVLWPDGAPGALGKEPKDIPTITVFLPDRAIATGAAMIICPGGGYGHLASSYEGDHYAMWLNEQGISAFVLKYRLGSDGYRHPRMWEDASRAMRLVRSKAGEWGLDTHRIGIIGSSAGGHLASTMVTHFDNGKPDAADPIERVSSRPDLGVLCYPVVTMKDPYVHAGSRKNLLGDNPAPGLIEDLSNELRVTSSTPPCFVWHTDEDKGVKAENSMQFAAALRKAGVKFELHIYEKGPHGMGLGSKTYDPTQWHRWTADCRAWLKEMRFGK